MSAAKVDWSVILAGPLGFSLIPIGLIQLDRKVEFLPLALTAFGVFYIFCYMLSLIIHSCRARNWKWALPLGVLLGIFVLSLIPPLFCSGLFLLISGLSIIVGIVYGWEHAPGK